MTGRAAMVQVSTGALPAVAEPGNPPMEASANQQSASWRYISEAEDGQLAEARAREVKVSR